MMPGEELKYALNEIIMPSLKYNEVTVILPRIITSVLVSASEAHLYRRTQTLPLQYSKHLQYGAHETADEAALSRCPAHMHSVRSVFECAPMKISLRYALTTKVQHMVCFVSPRPE